MTDSLRCLIVDDEPLAVERLQILCARQEGLNLVGTANDGEAALRMVGALQPDLIFLDISMPGLNGMEVARALEGQYPRPQVVFTTAYDEYAVAAFDVSATDYLLKPIAIDRLERAIARVRAMRAEPQDEGAAEGSGSWANEFWVPHRGEIIRIEAASIDLIEAERDYMRLHVGARSYLLHKTITELERKLDPNRFVRLHRSTIVRRDVISGFKYDENGAWQAQLADGRSLRVGRTYIANAREIAGRN
jgi:two-component system response regulator AlgR